MSGRMLAALCLLAAGYGAVGARAEHRVTDATGATIVIEDSSRVVSVGGAVTETVYALGLAERVIAVDSTSSYPEDAASKPDVGYMRQLAAEPILALEPSLVLAVEDSGPPTTLDQLRAAGVPVVLVPDDPSPQGVIEKITRVAAALDVRNEGDVLAQRLGAELDALSAAIADLAARPRVLFLLSIGTGGAPLAAGRETSAEGIIALAGGINAIDAFTSYKPLSPEAAAAAAPDAILITERSLALLGGEEALLRIPEIAVTPAGQNRRVVAMDGLLLLGFGPRTGTAVTRLAQELHPEIGSRLTTR